MITYFVIKHLPSGQYFPQRPNTGRSHIDLPLPVTRNGRAPLLFTKAWTAKSWLTTYCKGPFETKYTSGEYGEEERDGYTHDASRARNPADFKVQKIEMSFKEIM